MSTPPRRNVLRIGVLVLVLLGGYYLPNLLNRISDLMFHPWALAEPPLLDRWVGQLTAGNGDRLVVAMTLERDLSDSGKTCARCNQIEGALSTCDRGGTVRRYRLSGSPTNRQGRHLRLGVIPLPQPPPDGLELNTLDGHWNGGDALDLQADFIWRRGQSAVSSTNDPATQPVPLRMERRSNANLDDVCAAR